MFFIDFFIQKCSNTEGYFLIKINYVYIVF
jgi:hypothetical protein